MSVKTIDTQSQRVETARSDSYIQLQTLLEKVLEVQQEQMDEIARLNSELNAELSRHQEIKTEQAAERETLLAAQRETHLKIENLKSLIRATSESLDNRIDSLDSRVVEVESECRIS